MHRDPARAILDSVRRIVRALRLGSRRSESKVGLSGAQLFVLQTLGAAEPLSINALAERTFTHQSSVSIVASRLEAAGLLRRTRSDRDGRSRQVSLTAKGRGVLRERVDLGQSKLLGGIARLSAAERRALARLLDKMVRSAELSDLPPTMFFEGDKS